MSERCSLRAEIKVLESKIRKLRRTMPRLPGTSTVGFLLGLRFMECPCSGPMSMRQVVVR